MHRFWGWLAGTALVGGGIQFLAAVIAEENPALLIYGLLFCLGIAAVAGVAWFMTRRDGDSEPSTKPLQHVVGNRNIGTVRVGRDVHGDVHITASSPAEKVSLDRRAARRLLIKATPSAGENILPRGGGVTAWEIDAYLDIETVDPNEPLVNCRVKVIDLHTRSSWTEMTTREVHVNWHRDSFYQGQTYFFTWSGRPTHIDAIDIHRKERANIAQCIDNYTFWTTTLGAVGHMFHGDQYRLTVEITADNSLPLQRDYWIRMMSLPFDSDESVIEEWDRRPRN